MTSSISNSTTAHTQTKYNKNPNTYKKMNITLDQLQTLSFDELRDIAYTFDIPVEESETDSSLVSKVFQRYCEVKKYLSYTFVRQLGRKGKEGRTFLALDKRNREVAIKIFHSSKKASRIVREAKLQSRASNAGITPQVYDYDGDGKYIVMEKLDINLYDCFCNQKGQLTLRQQQEIVALFRVLDTCQIFHGDPNPLNFMKKGTRWYIIDFGFARAFSEPIRFRYGTTPNLKYMTLGILIHLRKIQPDTKLEYFEQMIREMKDALHP